MTTEDLRIGSLKSSIEGQLEVMDQLRENLSLVQPRGTASEIHLILARGNADALRSMITSLLAVITSERTRR